MFNERYNYLKEKISQKGLQVAAPEFGYIDQLGIPHIE